MGKKSGGLSGFKRRVDLDLLTVCRQNGANFNEGDAVMVFLRSSQTDDQGVVLKTERLSLRLPQSEDFLAWSKVRGISQARLVPFEPLWSVKELTKDAFRNRLRFYRQEFRDKTGYPFFIFKKEEETLIGGITLSNVQRGVTQSAALGYWMGTPYQNQGFMSEAVEVMQKFVFRELMLHRLEAATMPSNEASIRVLEKCGFCKEGLARRYLRINGTWSDHFLYSFIEDDFILKFVRPK